MWSITYRGTPEAPGLVLALDKEAGAACEGAAFEVSEKSAEALAYLRERELVTSAYKETWLPVRLATGEAVEAVTYVIDPAHQQYCRGLSAAEQAEIIARATGGSGPNFEYLFETVAHLEALGCPDADLAALDAAVRAKLAGA